MRAAGRALKIARGMIDWFSDLQHNWLLPEFMPPDRTIDSDVPSVYGNNTGHQIYLISQGIIHHSRMATSRLGARRERSLRPSDPPPVLERAIFSISIVIPFKHLLCVSLESLLYGDLLLHRLC